MNGRGENPAEMRRPLHSNSDYLLAFDRFMEAQGTPENTRKTYHNFIRRLSEFLGTKSFLEVRPFNLSEFRGFLYRQKFSDGSMASAVFALRKFYEFLNMGEVMTGSPARMLLTRLALLEFLYATGCRQAEVVNMNVEDICLPARSATVRRGKGDKDRVVLFGRPAARTLGIYLNGRDRGPLFLTEPRIQNGGLQLQGRSWIGFWRENREMPDGTTRRVLRGKSLGLVGERLRAGPKPHATITLAAKLRKAGRKWREIYRAVSPDAELNRQERRRLQSAVYYRLDDSKRKALKPAKRLSTSQRARKALGAFLEQQPRTSDQSTRERRRLGKKDVWRVVVDTAMRAGVGHVTTHQLRHSFATHCIDHGMDIRYLQELLGHTSLVATQKYLHSSPAKLLEVHRKFFKEATTK